MSKETLIERITFGFLHIFAVPIFCFLAPFSHFYTFLVTNTYFGDVGLTTKAKHEEKVKNVQKQIREWNQNGKKNQMCTSRAGWKTMSIRSISKRKYTAIKLDDMDGIVDIDTTKKMLTVEPGMILGKLTNILIPKGWTIPQIPEMEMLTVGGIICAAALETSGHKYGLFADTCMEYEIILPNAEVVICSKEHNSDLFYAIPWSHATIGFLTAVKIPLIPAKKYVKVEYLKANSMAEAKYLFEKGTKHHEFLEGISFGLDSTIIMYGDFANEADKQKVNSVNRWYKPWFYKHVESYLEKTSSLSTKGPFIEYIPLQQYYFRHSRSYFWIHSFQIPYGNNPIITALFGWMYPINFRLAKLLMPSYTVNNMLMRNTVVQDYVLPCNLFEDHMQFFHDLVKITPIWLCPAKLENKPGMCQPRHSTTTEMNSFTHINIGVYGIPKYKINYHGEQTTREMEKYVIANNGVHGTYADNYMTKEEFCTMFNMCNYDEVREKYNCQEAFPHVYNKLSRHARQI